MNFTVELSFWQLCQLIGMVEDRIGSMKASRMEAHPLVDKYTELQKFLEEKLEEGMK